MTAKSMGEIIAYYRKEKGMTQKNLAEVMNVTDKAVSKWERDVACPDTASIPKLADTLAISVEELMNAKTVHTPGHKGASYLINIILKAIPLAMGVAVTTAAIIGKLDANSGLIMLGSGMACLGIDAIRTQ